MNISLSVLMPNGSHEDISVCSDNYHNIVSICNLCSEPFFNKKDNEEFCPICKKIKLSEACSLCDKPATKGLRYYREPQSKRYTQVYLCNEHYNQDRGNFASCFYCGHMLLNTKENFNEDRGILKCKKCSQYLECYDCDRVDESVDEITIYEEGNRENIYDIVYLCPACCQEYFKQHKISECSLCGLCYKSTKQEMVCPSCRNKKQIY